LTTVFCPLCNNTEYELLFWVKDHTVSGEHFSVVCCKECNLVFTLNPPDKQAIGRYYQSDAYISHTDSKEGLFNRLYQLVRKRAIVSKKKMIEQLVDRAQRRLLDYGCGTGAFVAAMQSGGWNVHGIEPDPGARTRAVAQTKAKIADPSFLTELPDESMDVITLWHVLEHVHDLHSTLGHFNRILHKNGILLVAVPNHKSHDALHYGASWAAYDVPRHLYHFDPSTMKALMKLHGFDLVDMKPMWFDAFYVSLLSEVYRSGRMRPFRAMLTGIVSNTKALTQKGVCSSQIYLIRKTG
jgi:SAM-dependent methyltransferase